MEKDHPMPSLIPYLRSDIYTENSSEQKIRLILTVYPDKKSISKLTPFLTISTSDPICKILEAQFVTDAGSLIKKVFLLIQKDRYDLRSEDIWPINNQDIDLCWQRAYKAYRGSDSRNQAVIFFKEQTGGNDQFLPFKPLFFCMKTTRFFHPPCPVCGIPLQQCHDDVLLIKNGLGAYSSSLSRYLFCKVCAKELSEPVFYVKSLGLGDPVVLKDMTDILTGYYRLVKGNIASGIPCQKCNYFYECFENGNLSEKRIVPFSFYPFYMIAFDAPSINALEFLSLLSGSTKEEISDILIQRQEIGRKHCIDNLPEIKEYLLFEKNDRLFFEILYLKLCFLGEVTKNLSGKLHSFKYPDISLGMDKIWVKLNHENSMLPAFWNFKLVNIDIGGNIMNLTYLPKIPPFFGLYHLGIIWFYSLLVNERQDVARLHQKISKTIEEWLACGNNHFNGILKDRNLPEFASENIFWKPDQMASYMPWAKSSEDEIPTDLPNLWDHALVLGWHLLEASLFKDAGWSMNNFQKQLDQLKNELKFVLFREDSMPLPKSVPVKFSENRAISKLIFRIADKWQRQAAEVGKEKELVEIAATGELENLVAEDLDEDISETVIISGERNNDNHIFSGESDNQIKTGTIKTTEENIPETVMMFADKLRVSSGDQDSSKIDDNEFLSETLIMNSAQLPSGHDQPIDNTDDSDEIKKKKGAFDIQRSDATDDFDEDKLLRTVIINPDTPKVKK